MSISRRDFLKTAATSSAVLAVGPALLNSKAFAADYILVGGIHDLSGGLDLYGKPMADALILAAEEINEGGGLLGRQIKLITQDPQSNMQQYTQIAQKMALGDKVAVVQGGMTSSSREVIRPVLHKAGTLYFYNTQYEGGVCDRNTFCTGATPAQNLASAIPEAIARFGKTIYVVAADYNYGQIISEWVKKYAKEHGGAVVAVEFFPLDVSEFGPTIQKIQAAAPNMVFSALVGGAHVSFYRQWAGAGLNKKIPLVSSTFSHGQEQKVLSAEEGNGIVTFASYFETIDTPANKAFLARWHKRFGDDYPVVTEFASNTYQGMHLWAKAVTQAGTTDRMKVIEALETGLSFDGPSGKVTIDPQTHHVKVDARMAETENQTFKILKQWDQQASTDTQAVCNLIDNPDTNEQFVIKP
ncbi:twin-arginine translocation signal domain-containing protein [Rhizobium ruizarguesonis]|uniref:transporter substrate-binding protein n=1 Tax=Rhizobium ruizarguesonis TaxID=2081791 RepID=UPI0010315C48|nr:transporter substrate-binding protein [Rhizobium ruizarguesonis]QIJ38929.1 transporter substrate-binding protein [Rhizobium leguminosarum]NEH30543.1 transporter substrate-binding protein [Rhizobium ruizarguesonis]NEJ06941.1 transporter substrate-binding protein [Rhizobium ruizarguesonis]NEK10837.1 transporter substrate-binding protein [Rhizobium ruizarguesonis]TAU08540.1 twin-arginine translocation signal domain-containing protein [Rhizobium ruizarguesonis]